MPFVLANFARGDDHEDPRRLALAGGLSVRLAIAASLVSVLLAGTSMAYPPLAGIALSGSVAGATAMAAVVQQFARIRWSASWMALGLLGNIAVPLSWLLLGLAQVPTSLLVPLVAAVLALVAMTQAAVVRSLDRPATARRGLLKEILRVSVPLVPHLLAFGIVTQGIRLTAVLSAGVGHVGQESVAQASYVMAFVAVAFTTIASVHGLLSTTLQQTRRAELNRQLPLVGLAYGILGAFAAVALAIILATPIRLIFKGFAQLELFEIGAIAAVPAALVCYYLQSTLLVRDSKTPTVSVISCTVVGLLLVLSNLFATSLTQLIGVYSVCVVLLQVGTSVINLLRLSGPERTPGYGKATMLSLVAYLPSIGAFAVAVLA
ncbi:hypothetical protein ACWKWN_19335 [Microbacterium trichothecenolyticum]